jgi:hypothetical protein
METTIDKFVLRSFVSCYHWKRFGRVFMITSATVFCPIYAMPANAQNGDGGWAPDVKVHPIGSSSSSSSSSSDDGAAAEANHKAWENETALIRMKWLSDKHTVLREASERLQTVFVRPSEALKELKSANKSSRIALEMPIDLAKKEAGFVFDESGLPTVEESDILNPTSLSPNNREKGIELLKERAKWTEKAMQLSKELDDLRSHPAVPNQNGLRAFEEYKLKDAITKAEYNAKLKAKEYRNLSFELPKKHNRP